MTDPETVERIARGPAQELVEAVARALSEAGGASDWPHALKCARAVLPIALQAAAKVCENQQEVFGSDEYATGQPLSSFSERFACGRCAEEILALTERKP